MPQSEETGHFSRNNEQSNQNFEELYKSLETALRFNPFSTIPNEVVEEIISYLGHTDLNAVLRVCKRFRKLCEPFLYRDIDLSRCGGRIDLLLRTLVDHRPDLALCIQHIQLSNPILKHRSVLSNPILHQPGSFQHIQLPNPIVQSNSPSISSLVTAGKHLSKAMTGLAKSLGKIKLDTLEERVTLDDLTPWECCLALVISISLNLRSLDLSFGCRHSTLISELLISTTAFQCILGLSLAILKSKELPGTTSRGEMQRFSFFHRVKLSMDDRCDNCNRTMSVYQGLQLLYRLPGIQKFTLNGLKISPSIAFLAEKPYVLQLLYRLPGIQKFTLNGLKINPSIAFLAEKPYVLQLTHLTITNTDLCSFTLEDVLKTCPNLIYLKFKFHMRQDVYGQYFDCIHFEKALSHVSRTLEHLIIEVIETPGRRIRASGGLGGTTLNLSEFRKIQILEVPTAVLLGIEPPTTKELAHVLPFSLRRLSLSDWECIQSSWAPRAWKPEDTFKYLAQYIKYKSSQPQPLEEIGIILTAKYVVEESFDVRTWWRNQETRNLKNVCDLFGVKWDIDVGGWWNSEWVEAIREPVPVFAVSLQHS